MKENKHFRIDIYGLRLGSHSFSFDIDNSLFEKYDDSVIESGKAHCAIELVKKERLIEVNFSITGTVELVCDRSLEAFDHPIDIEEQLILKYGEDFDDSQDDIWTIPDGQQSINVEKCIFDYLTLSIPMKKLHPKFEEEEDDEYELSLVYSSEEDENESEESDDQDIDPRWALLKNIKNKEN
ncbi:DUF177 domain-containing protein [Reichenbachiella agarivorans]|uniref:DUF177 domain-containing protein n=1 Tax=Reichenbachiella agarivorans TaxID=2979464 RepID=A0ABY6CJQ4_9BACT|nr:DUF177 domain-containing protein [Reichenbachiella agarivorans]UXP30619.1 DUF177 domain-containing protein [Reichenbachiella agarivorans]